MFRYTLAFTGNRLYELADIINAHQGQVVEETTIRLGHVVSIVPFLDGVLVTYTVLSDLPEYSKAAETLTRAKVSSN